MKKYFFALVIGVSQLQSSSAQKLKVVVTYITSDASNKKPVIYYSPSVKLTWNDFKGTPPLNSAASAITNAGIGFKMAFHSLDNVATLDIIVNCNFSVADSWVKEGKKTPYILNHEQHHFDIAYLHAMQFIEKLRAAKYTDKDYAKVIEKIYYEAQQNLQNMQTAYDGETKNSQLPEMQALWDKKIDAQLALLVNK